MHEHRVPMRWADLDSLDHVNNVVYLSYAAEGRAAMVDDGGLAAGLTPVSMTVRFVRPLRLGRRPVVVTGSVDGDDVVQQIALDSRDTRDIKDTRDDGDDGDGVERTVFAVVTTRMGERTPAPARHGTASRPMSLRRDDLDADGCATPAKVFELFQETRVLHVSAMLTTARPGRFVVGTSSVTFRDDIRWTPEPLRASAWVSRVGNGSFDMFAELSDGRRVLAESTTALVGFDPVSQTSQPFDDDERAQLAALVPPPG